MNSFVPVNNLSFNPW